MKKISIFLVLLCVFGDALAKGCRSKTCTKPKVWSRAACDCVCTNSCEGYNQQLNKDTCKCECEVKFSCDSPEVFLPEICDCGCPKVKKCDKPMYFSYNSCDCKCPAGSCPGNQVPIKPTCECGCPSPAPTCPETMEWDSNKCRCVCKQSLCPCKFNQYRNLTTCGCVCNNTQTCPTNKIFNTDLCQCKCINDNSATCNQRVPVYGWNEDGCSCDFCPDSSKRKTTCESQAKYYWDAANCTCQFCPLKTEKIHDCTAKGTPYDWSESQCDCVFCLNRNALKTSCANMGSTMVWNDAACDCARVVPTSGTGGGPVPGSTSPGIPGTVVFDPFKLDFGSIFGLVMDGMSSMFQEFTANLTANDFLGLVFQQP